MKGGQGHTRVLLVLLAVASLPAASIADPEPAAAPLCAAIERHVGASLWLEGGVGDGAHLTLSWRF